MYEPANRNRNAAHSQNSTNTGAEKIEEVKSCWIRSVRDQYLLQPHQGTGASGIPRYSASPALPNSDLSHLGQSDLSHLGQSDVPSSLCSSTRTAFGLHMKTTRGIKTN